MKNTSISLKFYVFFVIHSKDADAHIHVCTLTPTNACMQPYPYEPSERLSRHHRCLTIDGHVAYPERITSVKSRMKPEKCKYPCRVEDSNPSGQVPPQGILPAELKLYLMYFEKTLCKDMFVFTGRTM